VCHRHLMAMVVFLFGLLSIALIAWMNQIGRRGDTYFHLANAVMDIQIYAAKSYVELDESLRRDHGAEEEKAWSDLDRAIDLCRAVLSGGESEYGLILPPLRDPRLRVQAEGLLGMLTELRAIARQRFQHREQVAAYSLWDRRSEETCQKLLQTAESIETSVEKSWVGDQTEARRLYYGIFLIWSVAVAAATVGIWSRERHRQRADRELLQANIHLESQATELRRHRERLTELVEERTVGLTTANSKLHKEIVERRETEEALRKSEEQYRMLVETMNEGLTILDDKGSFTYVNDRFCAMLGYSRAELMDPRRTGCLVSGTDGNSVADHLYESLRDNLDRHEVTFRTKDGQSVFTVVSPKGIYDLNGQMAGCFAVITDITEKITLEAQSLRTAHLASLGELAAGVAHEINNPANGIINYARILSDGSDRESQTHDIANRVLTEGRRIADIVRSLLLFARGGRKEKLPVHLGEILSNSLSLTDSQLKKEGIEVRVNIPEKLPELIADPHEIQQVFMNIISNARDALNLEYPEPNEKKLLQINAQRVGTDDSPRVRIAFRDRGGGIPGSIIHKIKEPFFSTKPRGRGTGLGLSISDGIIREHGGKLTIESAEGDFTNVVIDLPAQGNNNGKNPCN
jgi:PAS domain S-box-containing protein